MDWNSLPLLLKVKDVQRILGVSKTTAYELMHSKKFPVVRVGEKCFRVPRDAFARWLEEQAATK